MISFTFLREVFRPTRGASKENGIFVRFADAVSTGMGTPINICLWMLATIAWFALFAFNPDMQNKSFMPSWFTSNEFNFPLNTITTLAELFIGFLIAAAANRVEKRNRQLHETVAALVRHIAALTDHEEEELHEIIRAVRAHHPDDLSA